MCLSTPPAPKECKAPLGTLETMHDMLNCSFSIIDQPGQSGGQTEATAPAAPKPLSELVAQVWVTRYVDYTTKYGLGFLFNTGSAGVYFNDSTKIVLSADGEVFQYIERRKVEGSGLTEHHSQTHLLSCYPVELQKKVTLLRHFRNYMLEQERNAVSGGAQDGPVADDPNSMNGNPGLIRDGVVAEGASAAVRFGQSSVRYNPTGRRGAEVEMPYLKKWVRTKHAILFRCSNRTVQVVFYDRSEVLLSAQANVITYVNKQAVRTEFSLDSILSSGESRRRCCRPLPGRLACSPLTHPLPSDSAGRMDIAKRLKYTKDIMYRLIHTQSK